VPPRHREVREEKEVHIQGKEGIWFLERIFATKTLMKKIKKYRGMRHHGRSRKR
jgi:hypothetical protein